VLEEMADGGGGVELIVGVSRDPRFGPVVMVGIGGIFTELLSDIQVGLAPLTPAQALALLERLRGAPLLTGARGRPGIGLEAAAEVIALVTEVAAGERRISVVEINPLLVTAAGALALDARIVTDRTTAAGAMALDARIVTDRTTAADATAASTGATKESDGTDRG
jgi:acetate---CoA ligase (ADP-forming)